MNSILQRTDAVLNLNNSLAVIFEQLVSTDGRSLK